jgi:hypothetical protein
MRLDRFASVPAISCRDEVRSVTPGVGDAKGLRGLNGLSGAVDNRVWIGQPPQGTSGAGIMPR